MSASDVIFAVWWYASGLIVGLAAWAASRRGDEIDYEVALRMMLVGIAAGLVLFLAPSGVASIDSPTDFKLRLLGALAVAWTATALVTRAGSGHQGRPAVALAAFVGVNAPLLALVLSATMVCGGQPDCL